MRKVCFQGSSQRLSTSEKKSSDSWCRRVLTLPGFLRYTFAFATHVVDVLILAVLVEHQATGVEADGQLHVRMFGLRVFPVLR